MVDHHSFHYATNLARSSKEPWVNLIKLFAREILSMRGITHDLENFFAIGAVALLSLILTAVVGILGVPFTDSRALAFRMLGSFLATVLTGFFGMGSPPLLVFLSVVFLVGSILSTIPRPLFFKVIRIYLPTSRTFYSRNLFFFR